MKVIILVAILGSLVSCSNKQELLNKSIEERLTTLEYDSQSGTEIFHKIYHAINMSENAKNDCRRFASLHRLEFNGKIYIEYVFGNVFILCTIGKYKGTLNDIRDEYTEDALSRK